MGKATKWFRNILGFKKPDPTHSPSSQPTSKENRRWSFVKSCREKGSSQNATVSLNESKTRVDDTSYAERGDANKHAIARAWAHSAGRFSSFPPAYVGGCGGTRYELAAVKIQSTFRGYLARRALQALRSLVRLQALVRGHIERKRTAEWLRQMQTLLFRAQARARAGRAQLSESSQSSGKSSHFQHPGPPTPEKFEHSIRSKNSKYEVLSVLKKNGSKSNGSINGGHDKAHLSWNWSDHQMDNRWKCQKRPSIRIGTKNDEKSDKCRNLFHSSYPSVSSEQYSRSFTTSKDSTAHQTVPSPSSCEVQSLSPFTPAKSCCSQNCLSRFTDHNPNYMAYTESSRAKVRSLSAPKQRPQYERSSSTKRDSIHAFGDSKSSAQRFTALQSSFTNKAYPGSGRLDNFGMPVGHKF